MTKEFRIWGLVQDRLSPGLVLHPQLFHENGSLVAPDSFHPNGRSSAVGGLNALATHLTQEPNC